MRIRSDWGSRETTGEQGYRLAGPRRVQASECEAAPAASAAPLPAWRRRLVRRL